MMTNFEHIHTLLNKYWDCQTSVSEEKELQDFFSGNNVPKDLMQYIPLFGYKKEQQSLSASAEFDTKLAEAIHTISKEKKYITIRIFRPVLRIAASILLVAGVGISLFLIAQQNNKPYFAETYNDPNAAIKQATFALEKLSDALRLSEEASLKKMQEFENINLDWNVLDSLTTTSGSSGTDTENNKEVVL